MDRSTIALILVLVCRVICDNSSSTEPKYVEIFAENQQWDGTYEYNKTSYYCMLFIHSEHYLKKDGLLATFKDREGATLDVEGESPSTDALEVTFSVHTMFNHVDRFPANFTFQGLLSQEAEVWKYKAKVTVPQNGLFGEINLQPSNHVLGPSVNDDSPAWRYVVIIGIPIFLGVVGVAGTIGLVYWAIKKGYIRHVPKAYDSFDNPVKFRRNQESVHI